MINIDSNNLSYIDWAIGLFGIIITTIIAYHIHALSKKVSFRDRLKHQKIIKNYISELKTEIHYKGRNCKVIIKILMYMTNIILKISINLIGIHMWQVS